MNAYYICAFTKKLFAMKRLILLVAAMALHSLLFADNYFWTKCIEEPSYLESHGGNDPKTVHKPFKFCYNGSVFGYNDGYRFDVYTMVDYRQSEQQGILVEEFYNGGTNVLDAREIWVMIYHSKPAIITIQYTRQPGAWAYIIKTNKLPKIAITLSKEYRRADSIQKEAAKVQRQKTIAEDRRKDSLQRIYVINNRGQGYNSRLWSKLGDSLHEEQMKGNVGNYQLIIDDLYRKRQYKYYLDSEYVSIHSGDDKIYNELLKQRIQDSVIEEQEKGHIPAYDREEIIRGKYLKRMRGTPTPADIDAALLHRSALRSQITDSLRHAYDADGTRYNKKSLAEEAEPILEEKLRRE
jgi:hypothetical protein